MVSTYLLIGVLLLLMIPCFRGWNKSGTYKSTCSMLGRKKESCHTKREAGNLSSNQMLSEDWEKIHAQMDEIEKENQTLMNELESLKRKQRL